MSSISTRINKLFKGTISNVTSKIIVYKDEEVIKKRIHGNNKERVIEIAIRL